MIKSRTRKIWGDVWARKGRTILTSMAIFIGVAGTIALFSMGDVIIRQLQEDVKEDDLAMLTAFVAINAGETADNDIYLQNLWETDEISGLTEVMGFVSTIGYMQLIDDNLDAAEPDEDFIDVYINAYTFPYDLETPLPIEPLRMLSEGEYADGRYPEEGRNEVAIERRMAEEYDLQIDDKIELRILSASRSQEDGISGKVGTIEEWTITGIVFHPYAGSGYVGGPPDISVYTTPENANYITGTTGLTGFYARFVDFSVAQEQEEHFTNYIANETPYQVGFTMPQDPANSQLIQGAKNITGTMSFLALVALAVSGFLVVNVISSIVVEQKRQIGVMKSLGASRWDNFFMYAGIAFTYGLIGVIFGVIVGVPGGNAAAHALAPTANTMLDGYQISPSSIAIGVMVGLLIPVLAAVLPVWFGTRVKILDAMTDLGIDADYGSGPIARFIGILPIPITMRQGLSNISLKKSRLALTVVTLSIAAGAFMGIWAVFSSLTSGINSYIDLFNVEVGVFPQESRASEEVFSALETIEFRLPTDDGSEGQLVEFSTEPGFQLQVEFEGYEPSFSMGGPPGILAYGYDVTSDTPAFKVTVDEGDVLTLENSENGVIFSSMLATNMGKTIGNTVVIEVPGNTAELTIVGISDFPIDQVWIDWRPLARIAGFTAGTPKPNEYLTTVTIGDSDQAVGILGVDFEIPLGPITFDQVLVLNDGDFFVQGEPGIIISQALADSGSYQVGDVLTLNTMTGGGMTDDYPITGIVELSPLIPVGEIPDEFMAMYWLDLVALENQSLGGDPIPQVYFLVTNLDDPSAKELDPFVEEVGEVMISNGIGSITINFVAAVDEINAAFVTIQVILQAVAFLIALVGALGLLTTLSMSVFERQKEIGVMRSIGASAGAIAVQFLTEGVVTGVVAWLVGIPLAYLIQVGLLEATGMADVFPAGFSVSGTVIGLVGMMMITVIASLWPSISAGRKTVSEVLRYQ
jgi:ABC-type antimicrobial peptide transport system permease subunit